jgi:hypothetical protein
MMNSTIMRTNRAIFLMIFFCCAIFGIAPAAAENDIHNDPNFLLTEASGKVLVEIKSLDVIQISFRSGPDSPIRYLTINCKRNERNSLKLLSDNMTEISKNGPPNQTGWQIAKVFRGSRKAVFSNPLSKDNLKIVADIVRANTAKSNPDFWVLISPTFNTTSQIKKSE